MFGGEGAGDRGGFGPGMDGKSKLIVVDGEDLTGLEVEDDLLEVGGRSVDIAPRGIILTVFQEREVHGTETLVNLAKAHIIASVAAYIDLTTGGFDQERRPKRLIRFAEETITKMSAGQTGNRQTGFA